MISKFASWFHHKDIILLRSGCIIAKGKISPLCKCSRPGSPISWENFKVPDPRANPSCPCVSDFPVLPHRLPHSYEIRTAWPFGMGLLDDPKSFYKWKIGKTSDLGVVKISQYSKIVLKVKEKERSATCRQPDRHCGSFAICWLWWCYFVGPQLGLRGMGGESTIRNGYFSVVIGHNCSAID